MGVVAIVMLIACASITTLMMTRSTARRREIAVRLTLGATRARLVRQLLTEGALLSLCGGAVGVVIATWGLGALVHVLPAARVPIVRRRESGCAFARVLARPLDAHGPPVLRGARASVDAA